MGHLNLYIYQVWWMLQIKQVARSPIITYMTYTMPIDTYIPSIELYPTRHGGILVSYMYVAMEHIIREQKKFHTK